MARGRTIIYMTDGMIRVGHHAEGRLKDAGEERLALSRSPDDCRRFADFLRNARIAADRAVLCVPRSRASVRFLSLPSQDDRELRKMVVYEAGSILPYKTEEFVSGYTVTEKTADGYSRLFMVAVQRQVLLWYLDFVKWAEVRPDEVWVSTQPLVNALARPPYNRETVCLLSFDDGFLEIVCCAGGKLVLSRALGFGCEHGLEAALTAEALRNRGIAVERLVTTGAVLPRIVRPYADALRCEPAHDAGVSVIRGFYASCETARMDLLPPEFKADKIKAERKKRVLLLAAAVFLNLFFALNLLFLHAASKREYLSRLTARIREIDAETVSLQKKLSRINAYRSFAGSGSHKLRLLAGVAGVSPGQVLLRSLDMSGEESKGSLALIGRAIDADTVIRFSASLRESALVSQANVSYISKRGIDSSGWVDFEIKAVY